MGSNVVYTVTITNLGPLDSVDLHVGVNLPDGIVFQSLSCDDGSCVPVIDNGSIMVELGNMPFGISQDVDVTQRF